MQEKENSRKLNVRILAPGFKPNPLVLKELKPFIEKNVNFHFTLPENFIQAHPLNSNTVENRFTHLRDALYDENVDIIWCLRGGYGSIQLLPFLNRLRKPKKQKLLIGLSDCTSLHIYLNQFWGWSSLHASNIDRWIENKIPPSILKELLGLVCDDQSEIIFKKLKPQNDVVLKKNDVVLNKNKKIQKYPIIGGNLVTLTSHIGTPYQLNLEDKFLFIEDIGERAYRLDRCLTQWELSGMLKGCRGIFLGQFTHCMEPDGRNLIPWLFKSWAKKWDFPVLGKIESGHDQRQRPIPFGNPAWLKKDDDHYQLIVENTPRAR